MPNRGESLVPEGTRSSAFLVTRRIGLSADDDPSDDVTDGPTAVVSAAVAAAMGGTYRRLVPRRTCQMTKAARMTAGPPTAAARR